MLFILLLMLLLSSCSTHTADRLYNTSSRMISPTPYQTSAPTPSPEPQPELAASYNTPLIDKNPNRVFNIKLAAKAVNGLVLSPGEEFSFNDTVGRRTKAKGYKEAPILKGDDHADGIGGGVCQICATLYNAAKEGGFEITEHHNHKIEVAYAPNGTDATVNYGSMDFRFRNNSDKDVKINVYVDSKKVYAELYKMP